KRFCVPFLKLDNRIELARTSDHWRRKIDAYGPCSARGRGSRHITRPGRDIEQPDSGAQVHRLQQRPNSLARETRERVFVFGDVALPAGVLEFTKRMRIRSFVDRHISTRSNDLFECVHPNGRSGLGHGYLADQLRATVRFQSMRAIAEKHEREACDCPEDRKFDTTAFIRKEPAVP